MGLFDTEPFGAWLQAANNGDLTAQSPLVLNPNGGAVGIGTTSLTAKLDVNGDINANGAIFVKAAHEVGDANQGYKERQDYQVSLQRYVVEATPFVGDGGQSSVTSVTIDETLLTQLCQDEDGCSITLGMRIGMRPCPPTL